MMSDYRIEDGEIRLNQIDEKMLCTNCNTLLGLGCNKTVLVKAAGVVLISPDGVLVRCRQCKTLNRFTETQQTIDK